MIWKENALSTICRRRYLNRTRLIEDGKSERLGAIQRPTIFLMVPTIFSALPFHIGAYARTVFELIQGLSMMSPTDFAVKQDAFSLATVLEARASG